MTRVLMVDDEPLVLRMFARVLRRRDIEVDIAERGKAALELLHKQTYALVISDVRMPGMDGLELFAEVRSAGLHDGPFIFLTGHAGERRDELRALGAEAVIDKPVSRDVFVSTVMGLIGTPDMAAGSNRTD